MKLLGSILGPLIQALGKLLAMGGIYLAGNRAGSLKAANKSHARAQKLRKKADDIDDEIAHSSDGAVREWLRNELKRKKR